jgi:hypothetical protein
VCQPSWIVSGSPRNAATMKFDTTRPSAGCMRGPYVLKIRAMRVSTVLGPVVREHRLGAALPFVVARARPDRIDVSPVVFGLRMLDGVPVNLAGRSLQDRRAQPLRESEQVDSTVHAGLRPLHRIALVTTR